MVGTAEHTQEPTLITLTLDLQDATVDKLATLIDAALAAGADGDTAITMNEHTLRIVIDEPTPREEPLAAQKTEQQVEDIAPESPIGEAVRQVITDEAVRGLVENLLGNRNYRRF